MVIILVVFQLYLRMVLKEKNKGEYFFEMKRGAKTYGQIFPETRPRYPVNFDRSLGRFFKLKMGDRVFFKKEMGDNANGKKIIPKKLWG